MGLFVVNLSDVGEGVAEAELIEWHVAVGDTVSEDQVLGVVMTDKAAVEVPSSVLGTVVKLCAELGDVVAVGAELIHLEVDGAGNSPDSADAHRPASTSQAASSALTPDPHQANESVAHSRAEAVNNMATNEPAANSDSASTPALSSASPSTSAAASTSTASTADSGSNAATTVGSSKALAAPSVRQRARDLGVELSTVTGSGPAGRVLHEDLDRFTERRAAPVSNGRQPNPHIEVIKVVGLRRKIAEKMALANARIPHITIVEEIDVHNLEELRAELNEKHSETRGKLTLLPFVMKSIIEAVKEQPELNAHYDDEAGTITQYGGVHIGVATQTPNGLVVPVVRHSEANSLWANAAEVTRLAEATRNGQAVREELSGSTITLTSLGPLGAVATTPIINHPEVAIVGVNKMMIRPHWDGQQFVPRNMMNISCSFDHRVIDGWDAAVFVKRVKSLLEKPAMLFLDE